MKNLVLSTTKRGLRSAPLREASFHPVLASYMIKDFLYTRQETDKVLRPHTVDQNTTVFDAAKLMKNEKDGLFLNALIVTDESAKNPDHIVGIISERDIIRKLAEKDPKSTPVSALMSKNPKTLPDTASLDEAVELLSVNSFRHLPITSTQKQGLFQEELETLEKHEKCVGVLGINDTLKELFKLHVLHKYNKSTQQTLSEIIKNPKYVKVPVNFINSQKTAQDAVDMMNKFEVGSLVVYDTKTSGKVKNILSGIISEHDITSKLLLKSTTPGSVSVASVMTPTPVLCLPSAKTILETLDFLVHKKHRHFPLLGSATASGTSEEKKPQQQQQQVEVIEEVSGERVIGLLSARHLIRYVYHI